MGYEQFYPDLLLHSQMFSMCKEHVDFKELDMYKWSVALLIPNSFLRLCGSRIHRLLWCIRWWLEIEMKFPLPPFLSATDTNPQFTPDVSAFPLRSSVAVEQIGFHSSQCWCSHWTGLRSGTAPEQIRRTSFFNRMPNAKHINLYLAVRQYWSGSASGVN